MFAACMKEPWFHLPWVHFDIDRKQVLQLVSSKIHSEIEELSKSWLVLEHRSDVTYIKPGQPNVQQCGTPRFQHKHLHQMLAFLEKTHKDPPKRLQRFQVPCIAINQLHLFTHLMEDTFLEETSPPQIRNGRHK